MFARVALARLIAGVMVVLIHGQGIAGVLHAGNSFANAFAGFGYGPVEFFFALTGLLITYRHYEDLGVVGRFHSFWYKRMVRLYPVYWLICLFLIPACFLLPAWFTTAGKQNPIGLFCSIFLLPQPTVPLLGVTWTLSHDILFYVVFSLAIFNRKAGSVVAAAWGFSIVLWNLSLLHYWPIDFLCSIHNLPFLLGAVVGLAVRRGVRVPFRGATLLFGILGFLAVAVWRAFYSSDLQEPVLQTLLFGLAASAILAGLVAFDLRSPCAIPRWIQKLADATYATYLLHYPVQVVLQKLLPHLSVPAVLVFPALTVVGLCTGIVFHHFVEEPLYRLVIRVTAPLSGKEVYA